MHRLSKPEGHSNISFWFCAGERPLDDSKRLCAHLLEKAIDQLDGECETILGIFDLRSFGPQNADFGFVRFLVGTLLHAPCQQHASMCLCPCSISVPARVCMRKSWPAH